MNAEMILAMIERIAKIENALKELAEWLYQERHIDPEIWTKIMSLGA